MVYSFYFNTWIKNMKPIAFGNNSHAWAVIGRVFHERHSGEEDDVEQQIPAFNEGLLQNMEKENVEGLLVP